MPKPHLQKLEFSLFGMWLFILNSYLLFIFLVLFIYFNDLYIQWEALAQHLKIKSQHALPSLETGQRYSKESTTKINDKFFYYIISLYIFEIKVYRLACEVTEG